VYKGAPGSLKSDSEPSSGKAPFGSLVLCLPSPYEGGKLTVSHPEGYKTYDWETTQETEALYWAAFSSGYEAIVSGDVVMLEYKLYYEPRACSEEDSLSGLCCGTAPVNISSLTSYDILQNLLAESQWMPKGKSKTPIPFLAAVQLPKREARHHGARRLTGRRVLLS
jgi:hypothetical protein